jgi:hypothetical protein
MLGGRIRCLGHDVQKEKANQWRRCHHVTNAPSCEAYTWTNMELYSSYVGPLDIRYVYNFSDGLLELPFGNSTIFIFQYIQQSYDTFAINLFETILKSGEDLLP